ncbi:MAG: methyltransferase domain-containing protein [Acidobacteria bacterium]|nr:methyltransferase domain-containing protein [Acidobacteriota bacterium]
MRHSSDRGTLNARTLEKDHKRLAALLRPGLSVLDVGCGTGAITRGIAKVTGDALGIDRDKSLVPDEPGFQHADILNFEPGRRFDIVTAARTLQWISNPQQALDRMTALTKPGGLVVVLDYSHERNVWQPDAPPSFQHFYAAFLKWRAHHGWDNLLADHLEDLFAQAGLADLHATTDDELAPPGLWPMMVDSLGPVIVRDGFLTDLKRMAAAGGIGAYEGTQALALRTVIGRA